MRLSIDSQPAHRRGARRRLLPVRLGVALTAGVMAAALPAAAHAFCGFYVSGADAQLYNNATLVVMMRDGTRTVLSMQNSYQGPPEDFAMVVPVPVVLQEDNVKTLPAEVFQRVDQLAAPRLVEYWEQDPCNPYQYDMLEASSVAVMSTDDSESEDDEDRDLGVKIEAQFKVGEYEIVILSAQDSTGLDTWLKRENYRIPAAAEPLLRPYVASGMKFFVAKVDVEKVRFENGQAMLSPLRFHYDSEQFNLPIRLGLMNSGGTQDLLVHILAPGQRYEVANYDNITIATNIEVVDAVRTRFGAFYNALFDEAVARHPGAVVTEYAWDAGSCDPCPTPALDGNELATLGADVIAGGPGRSMVLTRLHARYGKDLVGEDLVFRAAQPIVGGRERWIREGAIERGAMLDSINNFQGRYVIRHAWSGPVACESPRRGVWGGPPGGRDPQVKPAMNIAFEPRGQVELGSMLRDEVKDDDFRASAADPGARFKTSGIPPRGGCASCSAGPAGMAGMALLAGLVFMALRRRPSRR